MAKRQPKRLPRPGVDEYGRGPLHYAALAGDVAAIDQHLGEGAVIDAQDDAGYTALHFAAQARSLDSIRRLIGKGANPNLVDTHGNGPLWTAIMNARGDFACVRALLEAGADKDHQNAHGRSPRDMALLMKAGLESLF